MDSKLLRLKKELLKIKKPGKEEKIYNYLDKLELYFKGKGISEKEVVKAFKDIKGND